MPAGHWICTWRYYWTPKRQGRICNHWRKRSGNLRSQPEQKGQGEGGGFRGRWRVGEQESAPHSTGTWTEQQKHVSLNGFLSNSMELMPPAEVAEPPRFPLLEPGLGIPSSPSPGAWNCQAVATFKMPPTWRHQASGATDLLCVCVCVYVCLHAYIQVYVRMETQGPHPH